MDPLLKDNLTLYLAQLGVMTSECLFLIAKIKQERTGWLDREAALDRYPAAQRDTEGRDRWHADLIARGDHQAVAFEHLETFLAVWARLSLTLFPIAPHKDPYRKERGETLVRIVGPAFPDRLADRDLRNAWMHFDERLDASIRAGRFTNFQRFALSRSVDLNKDTTLRLLLMDTLTVWFYDENGIRHSTSLDALEEALLDMQQRLPDAITRV